MWAVWWHISVDCIIILCLYSRTLESVEHLTKQVEPEMTKKAAQGSFLQKKARDYRSTIKQLSVNILQQCALFSCFLIVFSNNPCRGRWFKLGFGLHTGVAYPQRQWAWLWRQRRQ